jgi:hypothetical protein
VSANSYSYTVGFDERWLQPNGIVPVDPVTTGVLLREIIRMREQLRLNGPNGEGYPGIAHDFETLRLAASKLRDGFTYDPGHSDLDNEQPVWVRCSLGDWRRLDAALNATVDSSNPQTGGKDA